MGMDVSGKSGNYFRANVWSWRPILHVMETAGIDCPEAWSYNDGKGAETAAECQKMADKIEALLARDQAEVFVMPTDFRMNGENPYAVHRDHLKIWVEFLRECGEGFEIW